MNEDRTVESPANTIDAAQTGGDALPSDATADEQITFASLGIGPDTLASIADMGFETPTEVQARAVPLAMEGLDLMVQSRTGSGKTAAFSIPIVDRRVDIELKSPQALILAPTRELAVQVSREMHNIAAKTGVVAVPIYGGVSLPAQVRQLEAGAHVVVGTPGRVLDHLRRGTLKAQAIRTLVLDECDEMLSMGFQEEINAILSRLPSDRQTLLFSATIPSEIERMADRYLRSPQRLTLSADFVGAREIRHIYYMVSGARRSEDLLHVLDYEKPTAALIFCNTREDTARVAEVLRSHGYPAEGISSDLSQNEREIVMQRMREGKSRFLAATDVAARGIDIAGLSHVINYTFPESADVYVHRTGRTGRAGRSGVAISLVGPREVGALYYVKLIHKIFPEQRHLPSSQEIESRREGELLEQLQDRLGITAAPVRYERVVQRILSLEDGRSLLARAIEELLTQKRVAVMPPSADTVTSPAAGAARSERGATRRDTEVAAESETGERSRRDTRGGRRGGRGSRQTSLERPRRRSERRESDAPADSQGTEGTFVTTDGDVEHFETLEPSNAPTVADTAPPEGMSRLYINLGRRHRVRPEDVLNFIQIEGHLDASAIGPLKQYDRHSHIWVKDDVAEATIEKLEGASFQGRPVRVERARSETA